MDAAEVSCEFAGSSCVRLQALAKSPLQKAFKHVRSLLLPPAGIKEERKTMRNMYSWDSNLPTTGCLRYLFYGREMTSVDPCCEVGFISATP